MCFRYFKDKSKLRWIVCGFIDNEIKALNHNLLKLKLIKQTKEIIFCPELHIVNPTLRTLFIWALSMAEFLTSENLIDLDDLSKALYNTQSTCLSRKLTVSTKKRREMLSCLYRL